VNQTSKEIQGEQVN